MKMRQQIDEYLDGAVSGAQRAEVEAMLASDSQAAALKARMERERAHRVIALASYEPSREEAAGLAGDLLAACEAEALQPVGQIHKHTGAWYWTRRLIGVAAMLAIATLAFAAGRSTAPQTVKVVPTPSATETKWVVLERVGESGEVREFNSEQDMKRHMEMWDRDNRRERPIVVLRPANSI